MSRINLNIPMNIYLFTSSIYVYFAFSFSFIVVIMIGELQANSYFKGGKTLSSLFTYIHPSTPIKDSQSELKTIQSSPTRWRSNNLWQSQNIDCELEAIPSDECREITMPENENSKPATRTCAYEVFEDTHEPQSPWKLMPNLTNDSSFINMELYEFLQASLPNIVKGCQWVLLYR